MESSPPDLGEDRGALAHYSTGRLTTQQAETVAAWRERLQQDEPLPGLKHKGPTLRTFYNLDDRPPASCSDVIAAAVQRFLEQRPPDPLHVVRYHYQAVQAQKRAGQGHYSPAAPIHQQVSFYLTEQLTAVYEALRKSCESAMVALIAELEEQAAAEIPDHDLDTGEVRPPRLLAGLRAMTVRMRLAGRGLPDRPIRITGGVIARMAIDQAARRKVDNVLLDAVRYASDVHDQPHRARRDMHRLRR
ncbi:hypothetical protein [Nonomuraea dietziae]|uniref:hypothetical protein n=1 Tax=Nonomuraea dietziae TaxID=65515 RepID=UPI0033D67EEA